MVPHEDAINCSLNKQNYIPEGYERSPRLISILEEVSNYLASIDYRSNCFSYEKCGGKTANLAQQAIDQDLMLEEMKGIKNSSTKVAVLDSGFNSSALDKHIQGPIELRRGFDISGKPEEDEINHGSPVTSLFVGKHNIGLSPKALVTLYRINEPNVRGASSAAASKLTMMKACDEGNKIINYSYGTASGDDTDFENNDPLFVQNLKSKGCIVFKSAGNPGGFANKARFQADDSIFRVAAADPITNKLAEGYAEGETLAPGVNVRVLSSSNSSLCNTQDQSTLMDGSSFAAPIAAAIGANIYGILSGTTYFQNLSNSKKVELVIRVLKASEQNGVLNGYRAVKIAKTLGEIKKPNESYTVFELMSLYRSSVNCDKKPTACSNLPCQKLNECISHGKKFLLDCESTNDSVAMDLINSYITNGEFEMAKNSIRFSLNPTKLSKKINQHLELVSKDLRDKMRINEDIIRLKRELGDGPISSSSYSQSTLQDWMDLLDDDKYERKIIRGLTWDLDRILGLDSEAQKRKQKELDDMKTSLKCKDVVKKIVQSVSKELTGTNSFEIINQSFMKNKKAIGDQYNVCLDKGQDLFYSLPGPTNLAFAIRDNLIQVENKKKSEDNKARVIKINGEIDALTKQLNGEGGKFFRIPPVNFNQ
jgi:hypothetical protein